MGVAEDRWVDYLIRPGALFLVGDPKQAIYRFRGADVSAYVQARQAFLQQDAASVLAISTNFRSSASILRYVNARFETVLSVSNGQPGFTALDAFHSDPADVNCVAALDVEIASDTGKASAERMRDAEAEAVARMCADLIENHRIIDRKSGNLRACRPGDIALLAPTGSELWRYEEALERRGIAVATQAGKGFFRRQEVQDLIAITRTLADQRDTLALGALLRGPIVGLTDEEILDIIWALPKTEDDPERLPKLDLSVDPADISNLYARDIITTLQTLRRQSNSTTPYNLISQAIDSLRVRPILMRRHHGQAERALANVDLYLSLAKTYAVRGLRAFSETMTTSWEDEAREVEGRPDAQEEAVALYTIHAAKGLEWPIVCPINTMTTISHKDVAIADRRSGRFYCPVFGNAPAGYKDARDAEQAELGRERVRLWYVAATRARDLLVLPRHNIQASSSAWVSLLDLAIADLPALECAGDILRRSRVTAAENLQTRDRFVDEAAALAALKHSIKWLTPSRNEGDAAAVLQEIEIGLSIADRDGETDGAIPSSIQGGRERGLILHKLIEEVLNKETGDSMTNLVLRAQILMSEMGCLPSVSRDKGVNANELAETVARSLALPEIAALRPRLMPEFSVYASESAGECEEVTVGVTDAIALDANGAPDVVVDWKSDVAPKAETLDHYRAQVRTYLEVTGANIGYIVLMTSGTLLTVCRA